MNKANEMLKEITELNQRRKDQLKDQLKLFKDNLKSASSSDKSVLQKAIKVIDSLIAGGESSPADTKLIFKALEI